MIIVGTAFAFLLAGQAAASAPAPEATTQPAVDIPAKPAEPTLEQVRAATERYRDVKVALAEGYERDPTDTCETAELMGRPAGDGAMGIHFAHPGRLGFRQGATDRVDGNGTHTDFLKPGVLIYEPQADGTLELVAVENLVFLKSWEVAGNTAPPTFQGVAYDRMVDDPATKVDEAHMFEPHYDRHVWLYRDNPNGIFAQFNPNVSCKAHKSGSHHHAPPQPAE
jgi:hypothetical protein